MINHCNTLAHNKKDASSQAIKCRALSYAQEVLTPKSVFAIHHYHSSKEKGINMPQLCSHRVHVWVENWEAKTLAECWTLSNTYVPMHCLPTSVPSPSTCDTQGSLVIWESLEWCPIKASSTPAQTHYRKIYKNDLKSVWCHTVYKTFG